MSPLSLLESCAGEFAVKIGRSEPQRLAIEFDLVRPSGDAIHYSLEIWPLGGNQVAVRECPPERLPRCCPDRHINRDGTFCMHWAEGDPLPVADTADARAWWDLLRQFLERQEAATRLRKWPGSTRAHGEAARYQRDAEALAGAFGIHFEKHLKAGDFRTHHDNRRYRNRIELLCSEQLINRISLPSRILTNVRMPCPCSAGSGTPTAIGACGDCAQKLARFIDALHHWHKTEREFFALLKRERVPCCRTLRQCALL